MQQPIMKLFMFEGDSGVTNGYRPGTSQLLIVAMYDETLRLTSDSEKVVAVELISQNNFNYFLNI